MYVKSSSELQRGNWNDYDHVSIGGAEGTEAHAEESPILDAGKTEVIAGKKLVAEVGSTSLSIGEGILEIKTNTYLELGTDRSVIQAPAIPEASPEESVVVEEAEEEAKAKKDTLWDIAQIALDVVGAIPVPGIATAANLINAGISLARGDYWIVNPF